jgi:hypothetical protein
MASEIPKEKTPFLDNLSIVAEMCLPSRCIETAVFELLRACSFPREPVYLVFA